jgi:hypothetical protein
MEEKRTLSQNDALHLWLEKISKQLIEQGHTFQGVMEQMRSYEVKPTMLVLKEGVWKPVQKKMFGITSTKELLKSEKQIDDIVDVLCGIFGKMGVVCPPFPSQENKNFEETYNQ